MGINCLILDLLDYVIMNDNNYHYRALVTPEHNDVELDSDCPFDLG